MKNSDPNSFADNTHRVKVHQLLNWLQKSLDLVPLQSTSVTHVKLTARNLCEVARKKIKEEEERYTSGVRVKFTAQVKTLKGALQTELETLAQMTPYALSYVKHTPNQKHTLLMDLHALCITLKTSPRHKQLSAICGKIKECMLGAADDLAKMGRLPQGLLVFTAATEQLKMSRLKAREETQTWLLLLKGTLISC